jgi:hypothetical protein
MSVAEQTYAAKCREHWERLKLSSPETLKQRILEAFDRNTNQQQVIVDLYKYKGRTKSETLERRLKTVTP